MWKPIDTYIKPTKEWDYDFPRALFFSAKTGTVIATCVLTDEDTGEVRFSYDCDGFEIIPTHWMPLPDAPEIK